MRVRSLRDLPVAFDLREELLAGLLVQEDEARQIEIALVDDMVLENGVLHLQLLDDASELFFLLHFSKPTDREAIPNI